MPVELTSDGVLVAVRIDTIDFRGTVDQPLPIDDLMEIPAERWEAFSRRNMPENMHLFVVIFSVLQPFNHLHGYFPAGVLLDAVKCSPTAAVRVDLWN